MSGWQCLCCWVVQKWCSKLSQRLKIAEASPARHATIYETASQTRQTNSLNRPAGVLPSHTMMHMRACYTIIEAFQLPRSSHMWQNPRSRPQKFRVEAIRPSRPEAGSMQVVGDSLAGWSTCLYCQTGRVRFAGQATSPRKRLSANPLGWQLPLEQ